MEGFGSTQSRQTPRVTTLGTTEPVPGGGPLRVEVC